MQTHRSCGSRSCSAAAGPRCSHVAAVQLRGLQGQGQQAGWAPSIITTSPTHHYQTCGAPSTSSWPVQQRSRSAQCAALTAPAPASASDAMGDLQCSRQLAAVLDYALEFARASRTYEVNSWMLLLGILKLEQCTAAKTLKALGLDDLYGAWHEVLWAMQVVDALEPRPVVPEIGFADRAYHVLLGATRFAEWGGRTKVQSEDLLMALAAGGVLDGLFPDLRLTFSRVRKAVEKQAGGVYVLPDDDENAAEEVKEEDNFL